MDCAACGFRNDPGEKFCGGCGTSLGAGTTPDAAVAARGGEAERRPITVLFADLCGFTRLSQSLDPEEVHRMLGRYFETVDDIIERCGGTIDKHIGDAVMAVFGAPIAHGDEAQRAVRAALEIHAAVPALEPEMGQPLAVHIGIAAGEVMASGLGSARHRTYTVIGQSVNLAARLLQVAGAGETVLDSEVHQSAQRVVRCVAIDDVRVKGIETPLQVWRLIGAAQADAAEAARPLVGRRAELAQLAAVLESCTASGTGSALYLRGEAGIGKSRLVAELQRLAMEKGYVCHTGLVLDFGMGHGRDAIREAVAGLLRLSPDTTADERRVALERALAHGDCAAEQAPYLTDLLDLPQAAATRGLYEAMDNRARQHGRAETVVSLLRAASARTPILATIEDVHWADQVTLDQLAAVTRAVGTMPVVLAMTSRLEGDPLDTAWRASVQPCPLTTIDLGPLRAEEAMELAGELLTTSHRFATQCIERAAGNPLFLEQLLRAADEHEEHLPATLHSLVLARLDRLPERDRAALRAAAVIGQRFSLPLLRQLANMPDYACDRLLAHALVRPDGDEFLFAHALIRDGVYASLTKARRSELHRTAAAWFADRDTVLRAEHLDRAEMPEAARAYLDAALAQAAALHPEHALALAKRGAALASMPADVMELNMLRGRLRCESGEGKPAVEAYQTALAAAQGAADRCRALIGIAAGQRLIAGIDAAFAALAEAEPLAEEHGLTRELAELHYTRGNLHFARGDIVACGAEHEAALACAQSLDDPAWEARATSGLADAAYAEGRMRAALTRFLRCVALCDANGLTRVAIPNRTMIGHCRIYLTEFDAGIADIEAARSVAVQVGDRHGEMFTLESQGLLLVFCNRFADAGPLVERGLALAEAIGARRYQTTILLAMAEAAFAHGRSDEAHERIERALALSRETGMRFCGPLLLGLKARLQDDAREREQCCIEAEALLAKGCVGHNAIGYYRYGIEDALARGEWSRVLERIGALADYTRREPLPYSDFLMARGRTLVALAHRPQDAALQSELSRLRADAERVRWPIDWPEWAVAGVEPRVAAMPR